MMKKIVGGWLVDNDGFADTGYCMLEDGTMLIMQKHYALTPEKADVIREMLEKVSPVAGGNEAPMVTEV